MHYDSTLRQKAFSHLLNTYRGFDMIAGRRYFGVWTLESLSLVELWCMHSIDPEIVGQAPVAARTDRSSQKGSLQCQ